MASGKSKHDEYLAALGALGRELSRRAGSACELSGEKGALRPYDLEGPDVAPDLAHVVLVCADVAAALDVAVSRKASHKRGRALSGDVNAYRYLETAVWSTEPAVRRAACRLLEVIADEHAWASDALDNAAQMDAAGADE